MNSPSNAAKTKTGERAEIRAVDEELLKIEREIYAQREDRKRKNLEKEKAIMAAEEAELANARKHANEQRVEISRKYQKYDPRLQIGRISEDMQEHFTKSKLKQKDAYAEKIRKRYDEHNTSK